MPTIQLPEAIYQHLIAEAVSRNMTVEELAIQRLGSNSERPEIVPFEIPPLRGEAWQKAFEEFQQGIESMANQYPPGFELDVSREAMYEDRLGSQL